MSRLSQYRESVIGLGYDFIKARVLQTAFELDLFERLGGETKTALTLANELKANPESLELFLNALVSLGLLTAEGSGFRNTKFGLEIFLKNKPLYIGDYVALQSRSVRDWLDLKEAVVTGKPLDKPDFFKTGDSEATSGFACAMHNTAMGHADYLARKVSLNGAKTLLDLGGGPGTFSAHFLKANPSLRVTIFDLPTTLETTRKFIERENLSTRVEYQAGDFNEDPIQGAFDICFLSHIIHGQTAERNEKLFSKIFKALNPGGRLIVQDFFLNPDKQSPQFAALFAIHMLIYTDGGRTYSFEETEQWMNAAGFSRMSRSHLNLPRSISLLIGQKR